MNNIANVMDNLMGKLKLNQYLPKLNPETSAEDWLSKPGSPKAERPDEEPKTMDYEKLIKMWQSSE